MQHPGLGSIVRTLILWRVGYMCRHRSRIDDLPIPAPLHMLCLRLSTEEHGIEVQREDLSPLLEIHCQSISPHAHTGIVHTNGKCTPVIDNSFHHLLNITLIGHIGLDGYRISPTLHQCMRGLFSQWKLYVHYRHLRTCRDKRLTIRLADPLSSSGHQCSSPVQTKPFNHVFHESPLVLDTTR